MKLDTDYLKPMEPVSYPEPFDDKEYVFEVKWDGVRTLACVDEKIRLLSKRGRDWTMMFPDLVKSLRGIPDCILDGEIIALSQETGKPSFPLVMKRVMSKSNIPVYFMVFDVLQKGDVSLLERPLMARKEVLERLLSSSEVSAVDYVISSGEKLYKRVKELSLEGIVAKKLDSPYVMGKSEYWLKIKYRRRQKAIIIGYEEKGQRLRSLALGAYLEGKLKYIGRVGSGIKEAEAKILIQHLRENRIGSGKGINYVKPVLTVLVEYAEWTEKGQLRSPSLKGFLGESPESIIL